MMRSACVIVCLLILNFSHHSFAVDATVPLTQTVLDTWTSENQLPPGRIHKILQTRDGYLWLATDSGLARFDGIKFALFDSQNTSAFAQDAVVEMMLDHEGCLWLGFFKGGLVQYKEGNFTPVPELAGQSTVSIFEDKSHRVWIGTDTSLWSYKRGQFESFRDSTGVELHGARDITQTADGILWFWSHGDTWELKNNKLSKRTEPPFAAEDTVEHPFYLERSGKVWFSTTNQLASLENENVSSFKNNSEFGDRVSSVLVDSHSAVWIGTRNRGLFRYFNGKLEHLTVENGLTLNEIFSLAEDREGSIWIGTNAAGLNRLRDGKVVTFSGIQGMPAKYIQGIFEDSKASLWFATEEKGAVHFENGQFAIQQGLSGNSIYSIAEDSSGAMWFGTAGWGLDKLERGKVTVYNKKDGLRGDAVLSLYPGKEHLLIGSLTGAMEYKDGTLKPLGPEVPKPVAAIYEASNGDIWIASYGVDLIRLTEGKTITYGTKQGLLDHHVLCFHEDSEGTLWLGTYAGGLYRFKNGILQSYTRKNGLYQNVVYSILEDDHNRLWMGSSNGIFSVSKRELKDFADGKISLIHSTVIGKEDGMKSAECNNGSAWKTKDGKLWFGTMDGAVMLDPDRIPMNSLEPSIVLEQALADDQTITSSLSPGTKKLEFHFASLSLVSASKNQFQYMLEGFDSDWSWPSTTRAAYYSNLPPGNYTFRVRGSNNDGVWNQKGTALKFHIAPYFFQRKSFYAFCLLLILLILYMLYRYRLKQIRSRFQLILEERNRISHEMHDTITQDFSGIILQLQAAELQSANDPKASLESISRARELASTGLSESRRFITALRPHLLEKNGLVPALSEFVRTTHSSSIPVKLDISGNERPLAQNVEDQLLRISQEAITNALKYSKASSIGVHLNFSNARTTLKISDNGVGFDSKNMPEGPGGFGIPGMKERAMSIGANCFVESEPGKGTTIIVEVPEKS
ncbi:MAG: hypothetical protein C5B54_02415 [Acidobacteria bacterium]|nr:MAG: hypothetical protein C5B54_02415 [Acidobacteriota bacterium]